MLNLSQLRGKIHVSGKLNGKYALMGKCLIGRSSDLEEKFVVRITRFFNPCPSPDIPKKTREHDVSLTDYASVLR
jgi:hypothetical protein